MRATSAALLLAGLGLLSGTSTHAAADTELLELRNTILNLVDELVGQGVLSVEKAAAIKSQAALKAREQVAQAAISEGRAAPGVDTGGQAAESAASPVTDVIRVPYVPEFVKDEIRAQVRAELRDEVTRDVVAVAKAEKWGTAAALPEWISQLEISGDLRLRGLGVYQDEGNNDAIPDFQSINEAGGAAAAGEDVFLNSTDDLTRGQVRLRLGLEAQVAERLSVVARLATGNDTDPTTRNQRLGNYNRPFDVFVDLAYGEWRSGDALDGQTFLARGGRIPNPFRYTSMLFDDDLTFDGFSLGYRNELLSDEVSVFANLGGFALLAEEANPIDSGTNDKYWWGGQVGVDFDVTDDFRVMLLGSYYDFVDIVGQRNDFNSTSRDWTAPAFIAKGNTVFDIRNDLDPDTQLFALASDFQLLNAMLELDYGGFDPVHVVFRADYVENIGFDAGDVGSRVGTRVGERNQGWNAELQVGHPKIVAAGDWNVFAGYRYLQRDAVPDSFTDSDFHAGGTDAEGWIAGGAYGLASNLWLRLRWLAADDIDGAPAGFAEPFGPLSIDVLQVDLNASF
jgi:hypothetical protein